MRIEHHYDRATDLKRKAERLENEKKDIEELLADNQRELDDIYSEIEDL